MPGYIEKQGARERAEASFKRREQQKADAPVAMQEYRNAQQAALERMQRLREQRLAREAIGLPQRSQ